MVQTAAKVREDFDRIALLTPADARPDAHQDYLLRFVPAPCGRALDLGCGAGVLTESLARRAGHVVGVDLSPRMIEAARARCGGLANVELVVGDFFELDLPERSFDCIAAVAVLHHMDWVRVVERAKGLLRPGGRLLIVDLFRDETPVDYALSVVAASIRRLSFHFHRPPRELRRAWAEHGRGDSYLSLAEARRLCAAHLPGAAFRRHLLWRYSVVWSAPA